MSKCNGEKQWTLRIWYIMHYTQNDTKKIRRQHEKKAEQIRDRLKSSRKTLHRFMWLQRISLFGPNDIAVWMSVAWLNAISMLLNRRLLSLYQPLCHIFHCVRVVIKTFAWFFSCCFFCLTLDQRWTVWLLKITLQSCHAWNQLEWRKTEWEIF